MLNVFKPSGAKATASFEQQFNQSLLWLTFLYAAILVIILFISGAVTYSLFSSRITHRFNDFVRPGVLIQFAPVMPTADDLRNDLIISLVLVNGLLILVAGGLSYWLATITLKPIKDAYERQQKFLSDASHELRTPLSILRIDLENELADNAVKGSAREQAVSHLEEVDRMTKLVSDLLLLSRLDENDTESNAALTSIALVPLVESIIKRLRVLAESHGISLHLNFAVDSDTKIISNEDLLSHGFMNVVQNAIVYNKAGGSVTVSVEAGDDNVCIVVKDTGIGMSKDDLHNIFNRFYRSDKSRSRQSGGSGLGLSITQSSIEHIGGTITIESELHKGTIVTICLPKIKL